MQTIPKLPPLIWLRAFRTAAKTGSFKAAAQQLNVSPSTISHEIRKLEKWVKTPLFHRSPGGIHLTDKGAQWISDLENAFEILDSSMTVFEEKLVSSDIKIGALPFVADELLLPQLSALELITDPKSVQIVSNIHLEALTKEKPGNQVDAVIRYARDPDDDHHWIELTEVALAPIVLDDTGKKPTENISTKRRIQLGENPERWNIFDEAFQEEFDSTEPPIIVDNYVSSLKAVERGLGIALAVMPLSNRYLQRNNLKLLSATAVKIPERYWFVCSSSHPQIETLKKIAAHLSSCLKNEMMR